MDIFQSLFEYAPNPYLILDTNLIIIEVNQAYLEATMTDRDMLIGRYLFDAFPANPEDLNANGVSNLQESMDDVLKYRKPNTMAVQKYDIPRRDGSGGFEERFWCSVNAPVLNEQKEVEYIIHNAQDVTSFIKGHHKEDITGEKEKLKARADHLETEIYKSAQALQEANKELKIANEAKSAFLTSMSHELRTPLNAILGFGQVLQLKSAEPLTPSQNDCVTHILCSGEHLLELINDVLDLAKIESGKTELFIENVNMKDVLDESLALLNASLHNRMGVEIINNSGLTGEEVIRADHTRAKQVFFNLLSNAVKYNREGGTVFINGHECRHGMLRVSISDTGRGIPANRQHEIFQPFKRLGAETTAIEGTGIGLSITRKMLELMAGEIGFDSQVDQGSTFWVEFPLVDASVVKSDDKREVEEKTILPEMEGVILYVEDNLANAELMKMIVSRINGLELIIAPDAEMGIAIAKQRQPSLIILDIHLPGMDGFEALKELRNLSETRHIPVMALSAAASKHDRDLGLEAGFLEYLSKPVDILKLSKAIKALMER